ncbi:MAG: ABC transporter permease [Bacteroidales bacterium]
MRVLFATIYKEFLQFFRNRLLLFLVLLSPLLLLATIPHAFEGKKRLRVGFCDNVALYKSSNYLNDIVGSSNFKEILFFQTVAQAESAMDRGELDLILIYSDKGVNAILDGTSPPRSLDALSVVMKGLSLKSESPLRSHYLFNREGSYKIYSTLSLIVLTITLISAALFTLNLVGEREYGLKEQFDATTISQPIYLLGKYIFFTTLSLAVIFLSYGAANLLYGLKSSGSLLHYLLFNTLFLFSLLGLTFLISALCKTQIKAVYLLTFVLLPLTMLSTLFSHLTSMPKWAALLRFINPIYFGVEGSRMIIFKGAAIGDLLLPILLPMLLLGSVLHGAAIFIMGRAKG